MSERFLGSKREILRSVGLATIVTVAGVTSERFELNNLEHIDDLGNYIKSIPELVTSLNTIPVSYDYDITENPEKLLEIANIYLPAVDQYMQDSNRGESCKLPDDQLAEQMIFENVDSMVVDEEFEADNDAEIHERAGIIARKNNLTLIDEKQYLVRINESSTLEEVIAVLNDYASYHSLIFSFPSVQTIEDVPVQFIPLDLKKLNLDKFKRNISEILNNLYYIPIELSRYAHVREIKLVDDIPKIMFENLLESTAFVDNLKKESNSLPSKGGFFNPITEVEYITYGNALDRSFSGKLLHELSHSFIFKYCGIYPTINDLEYASINPNGFSYGNYDSAKEFEDITSSEYGYQSVLEDAAYLMGDYILAKDKLPINALSSTERKKIALLLARIEHVIPGFTEYWISLKL